MTSDDETGDIDIDVPDPSLVQYSMVDYLGAMIIRDIDALAQRLGFNRSWSVVSLSTAYLKTEDSYRNKELHKSFRAVWNPEFRQWTLPPGRDLRRAYDGRWIVDGDSI